MWFIEVNPQMNVVRRGDLIQLLSRVSLSYVTIGAKEENRRKRIIKGWWKEIVRLTHRSCAQVSNLPFRIRLARKGK